MAKCAKCRGDACESCGQPTTCATHCYCQTVIIGKMEHVVCCKCGDRTASIAGQPWPSPMPFVPYYPIYPTTPVYPWWSSSGTITVTGTSGYVNNNSRVQQ